MVALPINYPNSKDQVNRIRAHAPEALQMAAILLAAGTFLGIMNGTGMIESIATDLIPLLPDILGPHLDILMAILGVPLVMIFSADQLYFSLMPVVQQIAAHYDITAHSIAYAMLLGENVGFAISPVVPSVYLAIGLAGVDLGKHIRYSVLWLWGLSLILFIVAVVLGLIG